MTNQHPITPPPELLDKWDNLPISTQEIFVLAAQWGADQELAECCEWIADWYGNGCDEVIGNLRTARRPKPPRLKEQALEHLEQIHANAYSMGMGFDPSIIRRALEQLDD
ncbi:MAG: hypothetical protein ACO3CQ_06375 [Candidatus Nanopelagicaceae bacterium]